MSVDGTYNRTDDRYSQRPLRSFVRERRAGAKSHTCTRRKKELTAEDSLSRNSLSKKTRVLLLAAISASSREDAPCHRHARRHVLFPREAALLLVVRAHAPRSVIAATVSLRYYRAHVAHRLAYRQRALSSTSVGRPLGGRAAREEHLRGVRRAARILRLSRRLVAAAVYVWTMCGEETRTARSGFSHER